MPKVQMVFSPLLGLSVARSARVAVSVPAHDDPSEWEDLEPHLKPDATLDELVSQLGDLREAHTPMHVCLRLIHQSKLIAEKEVNLLGEARPPSMIRDAMKKAQRLFEGVDTVQVTEVLRSVLLGKAPLKIIAEQYDLPWPATRAQVENKFREQCDRFHPDKIGDTRENNQHFAKIAAHFRVLREHSKNVGGAAAQ